MSAIATVTKATLTALAPFAIVYAWPKEQQVFAYIPKNAPAPLLSLPRPATPLNAIRAAKNQSLTGDFISA